MNKPVGNLSKYLSGLLLRRCGNGERAGLLLSSVPVPGGATIRLIWSEDGVPRADPAGAIRLNPTTVVAAPG